MDISSPSPFDITTFPLILSPSSRPPSPTNSLQQLTEVLLDKFTRVDHSRRVYRSLYHDEGEGTGLPPLESALYLGSWERSPWRVRMEGEKKGVRDVYEMKEGLPRNMDEWEEWDRERKVALVDELRASRLPASTTKKPTQQGTLTIALSSSKPGTSSLKPPPHVNPQAKGKSKDESPFQDDELEGFGGKIMLGYAKSIANANGGGGGKSLGEDEEILDEGGCSQMDLLSLSLPPPNPNPAPNPNPNHISSPPLLPDPKRTSTPSLFTEQPEGEGEGQTQIKGLVDDLSEFLTEDAYA